jgi:hypothetical protein
MCIPLLSFLSVSRRVSIGCISPGFQGDDARAAVSSISLAQFAQDGLGDHTYQVNLGFRLGHRLDVLPVYVAHTAYLAEVLFLTRVRQPHLLALFQELFNVFGGEGLATSQLGFPHSAANG